MRCETCNGRGKIEHGVMPTPVDLVADYSPDAVFRIELRDCQSCGGDGRHKGRVPVMQDGRRIGTVPDTFDPSRIKSSSWLYDPRPRDFRRGKDGEWVAASMLGPGDLGAVPGFVWERD